MHIQDNHTVPAGLQTRLGDISAATVVVDVDTMAEELKRLQHKKTGEQAGEDLQPQEEPKVGEQLKLPLPEDEKEKGVKALDSRPGSSPGQALRGNDAPVGPVHRPSWNGQLSFSFPGEEIEGAGMFRCGR